MPATLERAQPAAATRGLTTRELLRLGGITTAGLSSPLSPEALEAWLLHERLATIDQDGRLTATRRGLALGSALLPSD